MPPNGYTGGRVYLGQWTISQDLVVDYIIHYDNSTISASVEDVWVNWRQVLEILVPDGTKKQPNFKVVWTLESVSYCPLLDFVYHAALKSTSKYSSVFSEVVGSLVEGQGLVPEEEEVDQIREYQEEDSQMWRQDAVKSVSEEKEVVGEEWRPVRKAKKKARKNVEIGFMFGEGTEVLEPQVGLDVKGEEVEKVKNEISDVTSPILTENGDDMDNNYVDTDDYEPASITPPPTARTRKSPSTITPLLCQICSKSCSGNVRLYSHYVVHHPDSPSLHPPKPARVLTPCKLCGELYMRRSHLYKHYMLAHPDQPHLHPARLSSLTAKENMYHCKGCDKSFVAEVWLYKHCLLEHPDNEDIRPPKPLKIGRGVRLAHMHERGDQLSCGLPGCEHQFGHFKGLVRHERTHVEACICILCGQPCWSPASLIDHCDTQHALKSRYICRVCGFYNYTEINLKLHHVQVHMKGTKEYECPHCPYKSSNNSTFSAHVRNHNSAASYVCEECGKECATPQSLSTHRRSHQPTSSFPYACTYCPKRFPHVSLLQIHERVHTGEKPFQCNDCGQCFGSQSSLIKHNRNIHTPEEQMPYKCNECGKTFSKARRKVYFGHLKQHSGIRDHICPLCNAAFSSRGYLGNHFKKVHRRKLYEVEKEIKLKMEAVSGGVESVGATQATQSQGYHLKVGAVPGVGEVEGATQAIVRHSQQFQLQKGGQSGGVEAVSEPRVRDNQEYWLKMEAVSGVGEVVGEGQTQLRQEY
eukprot:GFUD01022513.1.p1 GENE.GFUD01022513.1~~GFUD01022513.1.p1  ORF type:complete len:752 (+),score=238.67 GFUD01022513.1:33-2288(+)